MTGHLPSLTVNRKLHSADCCLLLPDYILQITGCELQFANCSLELNVKMCAFQKLKFNLELNVKLNLELNVELNLKSNLASILNVKLNLKLALTFVWLGKTQVHKTIQT